MSRIGKKAVPVPSGVTVNISGQHVAVKGPKGELKFALVDHVTAKLEGAAVDVQPRDQSKAARSAWGMTRTMVANMVKGVTEGYTRNLEITGVGYRAAVSGSKLTLALGYSHPVEIEAPDGISFDVPQPTNVTVIGISKQLVGETAAKIRKSRPPEPYKGKGIRYEGEHVIRKVGKRA